MAKISVAEAARRLGVGVPRVHQRIADGSLPAERIGSQWVVDEASLASVAESSTPGRPLSARSAWALVALSEGAELGPGVLAPAERLRARQRLRQLLRVSLKDGPPSEAQVHDQASLLRSWLRNRAARQLYRASPRDLPDLRADDRVVLAGLSDPQSRIASGDIVEGYVRSGDHDAIVEDYLLSPAAGRDAEVVLHVTTDEALDALESVPPLLLAADLAEHRRPREEARAAELLRELAEQHPELTAKGDGA